MTMPGATSMMPSGPSGARWRAAPSMNGMPRSWTSSCGRARRGSRWSLTATAGAAAHSGGAKSKLAAPPIARSGEVAAAGPAARRFVVDASPGSRRLHRMRTRGPDRRRDAFPIAAILIFLGVDSCLPRDEGRTKYDLLTIAAVRVKSKQRVNGRHLLLSSMPELFRRIRQSLIHGAPAATVTSYS